MTPYLLPCSCGKKQAVLAVQAGEQIVCSCGATIEIPPLRQLQQLPTATTDAPITDRVARGATWSLRHGLITVGLLLGILFAIAGIFSRMTEPPIPKFDPARQEQLVEEMISQLTPAVGWRLWMSNYQSLSENGFVEYKNQAETSVRAYVAWRRLHQRILWSLAGLCAAFVVGVVLCGGERKLEPREDASDTLNHGHSL